ncbi:MAG: universal stress protein [Planctomycetota bacterium]|nr:MAG: universal stress protein [Planctomycetota bacterium]
MKLLVPLDGSVLSESMLVPAVRLAGEGGEVDLVRVLDPGRGGSPDARARQAVEAYLEDARRRLEAEGLAVRWSLEEGDPAERILVAAAERGSELIAMATHGEGGADRGPRGSVAERVLRRSAVPVFLANPSAIPKTHQGTWRRILVPLDGSAFADLALPWAARFAKRFGGEVILFDVHPPERPLSLKEQAERLRGRGIPVRRRTAHGDPAEQIVRVAKEADLVCMCSHGRTGIARWWYGSVAERVVRACDRPLVVVRPRSEGDDAGSKG